MRLSLRSVTLVLALGGCSATTSVHPTAPFTPELARIFDDSVDFAANVEDLGGLVATRWRRQIDSMSESSDAIAVVRVETVTSGNDASGGRAVRLTCAASRTLHGTLPTDGRVYLAVSEGEVGFNTVRGNETRLQSQSYVLFARWYTDVDGVVRAHWHLSPLSASLLQRVQDAMSANDPNRPRETVIRMD